MNSHRLVEDVKQGQKYTMVAAQDSRTVLREANNVKLTDMVT